MPDPGRASARDGGGRYSRGTWHQVINTVITQVIIQVELIILVKKVASYGMHNASDTVTQPHVKCIEKWVTAYQREDSNVK